MPYSAAPVRRVPTRLPQYLAALYGLMIVYASLEPFSGWMAPLHDAPFFLFEPWPSHITKFDIAINMLAYAPFGFLLALVGALRPPAARLAVAIGAAALLSLGIETAQMFLPTRDASSVDLICNSLGAALGGLLA